MSAPKSGLQQGLQLKQTQNLTLTPQLAQSIKLLQCNHQDLTLEISQMLEKNILLEKQVSEDLWESYDETDGEWTNDWDRQDDAPPSLDDDIPDGIDADMEWETLYDDDQQPYERSFVSENAFQTDWVADRVSFVEGLEEAIFYSALSDEQRQLVNPILNHLDEHYLLAITPEALAEKLGVKLALLKQTIDIIKHLEPAGVASQNAQECMLAQLRSQNNNSEAAINAHEILSEYFHFLAEKPDLIKRRIGLSDDEYQEAFFILSQLSPTPERADNSAQPDLITPEVFVYQRMGFYYASSNPNAQFELNINARYAAMVKVCQGDEKRFMQAQLQEARFFISALDQRQKTILRVSNAIVMQQQDFFIEGEKAIQPLRMKDIAELLSINESTVSRSVNGKYLSFNQRLIELKYFFAKDLSSTNLSAGEEDSGTGQSATAAKAFIKEIIAGEPPHKPYTDSKIVEQLAAHHIRISRRTVVKYREALGIEKTSKRKRQK